MDGETGVLQNRIEIRPSNGAGANRWNGFEVSRINR